jgi:hypothetical protein
MTQVTQATQAAGKVGHPQLHTQPAPTLQESGVNEINKGTNLQKGTLLLTKKERLD